MDIEQFIQEKSPVWDQLETLLEVAENVRERELGHDRIQKLVTLYRQACSDLNQARSYTANPELLDRLNQLTGRAYRFVYRGDSKWTLRSAVRRFLLVEVPITFRRESRHVVTAAIALLLGSLFGFIAVLTDRDNAETLVPGRPDTFSPREWVESLEKEEERIDSVEEGTSFGAMLYTHNIQVAFLAFSLGALTIVGGYWILFYNGIGLGALGALYFFDGVGTFFVAWIGPHGALELPAIIFAGAAGIRAGHALLLPGDLSRAASVRNAFPTIWQMIVTTMIVLVAAGLIEGTFSQFTAKTVSYDLKIAVAVILFGLLLLFLFVRRVSAGRAEP